MINVEFPEALEFLFEPARYKVLFGGRGGAKSWSVARALLIMSCQRPLRIMCGRELQNSIKDSVHRLLSDQIVEMGLTSLFEVQQSTILGNNGTTFSFVGLRHNITGIKSFEGADICWVEEAETVSKASWDVLIPTIRKPNSQIIVTFNPQLDTDETYRRFVTNPPPGAVVRKVNWSDNPWFPDVLRSEMEHLRATDPDAYLTVWEGHTRQTLDGAIYANELREATAAGRITRVPYEPTKPVHTFWDLGRSDNTSIWFAQIVGFEKRIIDHYTNRGHALGHYLKMLQERPYLYGTHWLPHDAENELLASELTIAQQMRAGGRKVRITPKVSVATGINAVRTVFPSCWFDAERCADGLNSLRRYRYGVNDAGQFTREPLHDAASHDADALRYLAVSLHERPAPPQPTDDYKGLPRRRHGNSTESWRIA